MKPLIVTVNRHTIASNKKTGVREDPFRCSRGRYGKPYYCSDVKIKDGVLVYDPENPLPCGATVWIECT